MSDTHPEVLKILRSLLVVMDNLELALASTSDESHSEEAFTEGVRGIHRQLTDLLYQYQVRGFTSVGTQFDPNRHEAVGQVQSDEMPVNQVAEEYRRGYLIGDKLFRVAQVLVNTEKPAIEEHIPPWLSSSEIPKPRSQPVPVRSAMNRPTWLMNPPQDTRSTIFLVGRSRTAKSREEGMNEAGASILEPLFHKLSRLWADHPVGPIYELLAHPIAKRAKGEVWPKLKTTIPDLDQWVDDVFWQQLQSDISGKVYDVAMLVAIGRKRLKAVLEEHGPEERWARMSFVDVGPILRALLEGLGGAIVCDIHTTGTSSRIGIDPGDIIIKVGNRTTEDAATVRRVLTRLGRSRRLFEVEFIRALEILGTVRMGGASTGWGRSP